MSAKVSLFQRDVDGRYEFNPAWSLRPDHWLYLKMQWKEIVEEYHSKLGAIYDPGESAAITRLVMEKMTGLVKKDSAAKKNIIFTAPEYQQLQQYLQRLLEHEPVQYVLNEAWFCGLKFFVDKNVLIPRPETEELVEWIIAGCKFPVDELSILDVGTGSGCIPVTLKRRIRKAKVSAIDKMPAALRVAEKNAAELGADVNFSIMDFLDPAQMKMLGKFDLVVSNPPYIPEKDRASLAPNVEAHEPGTALFVPGNNPLVFYEALAEFGKDHVNPGGKIYAEMNGDFAGEVEKEFQARGFRTEIKKDMQGKKRMIRAAW